MQQLGDEAGGCGVEPDCLGHEALVLEKLEHGLGVRFACGAVRGGKVEVHLGAAASQRDGNL